jgi:hypothetical protein
LTLPDRGEGAGFADLLIGGESRKVFDERSRADDAIDRVIGELEHFLKNVSAGLNYLFP